MSDTAPPAGDSEEGTPPEAGRKNSPSLDGRGQGRVIFLAFVALRGV